MFFFFLIKDRSAKKKKKKKLLALRHLHKALLFPAFRGPIRTGMGHESQPTS